MPTVRRVLRLLLGLLAVLILASVAGACYARAQLRGSLPQLDGDAAIPGLGAPVDVERDRLGVATLTAGSRVDAARALGFLHGQERFFQMDLQRRQPAGELSALVGARALAADRQARVHRFRDLARRAVTAATPEYRALLDAYAAGVNAGLSALDAPPFEYLILRQDPAPWQPEDSILTLLAMFNTLQGRQPSFERTFGTLHDTVPPALYEFLTARGSEWDAPVEGGAFPRPPIPGAEVFDLRRLTASNTEPRRHGNTEGLPLLTLDLRASVPLCFRVVSCGAQDGAVWPVRLSHEEAAGLGSNNWAVAGTHTADGRALVANDMHLAISVPNIWYRAVMVIPDAIAGGTLRLAGVTLPGLPSLVVGSNGHVAWGFTNTGGDWSDLVVVETDPRDSSRYLAPGGPRAFDVHTETIEVDGGEAEAVEVRWTIWGPVIGRDHRGRLLAQRWVAHDVEVVSSDVTAPERARTLDEALELAAGVGIPAQNFVAGDRSGRIAWTIAGPIPRRLHDGMRPRSWADEGAGWQGYLAANEFPRIVDPEGGRIWTANSPVVDGDRLDLIGEGGYADGIRSRLIRDRLLALDKATAEDMLDVQLEDGALFHERWREVLLATLTPSAVENHPGRAEMRRLVDTTWTGRASPDSVAYRLVRAFRGELARQAAEAITAPVRRVDPDFDYARSLRSEGPLWAVVTERPVHLLNPELPDWNAQLLAAVDTVIADLTRDGRTLASRTWGEFNTAAVTHPLGALPLAGRWLNMPRDPLAGDVYTPRAHSPRTGPSQRMVVSPGHEEEGILHMPTGQSGHPLSPHYQDQHRAWVTGEPLPFLPGPAVTTLRLVPR